MYTITRHLQVLCSVVFIGLYFIKLIGNPLLVGREFKDDTYLTCSAWNERIPPINIIIHVYIIL